MLTADSAVRAARTTFSSLADPNYRRWFCGQGLSQVGTWMQTVAQSWLVLQLSGSPTAVGVVIALESLPVLLLAPYGGVVADRLDKRRLLVGLQAGMGVLALVLGVLAATGVVALWQVFGLAALLGVGKAFESPARQAFVLEIVGPDRVRNAVSLNSVMINIARTVGPAVAGVLIAAGGTSVCFFVNAGSFVAVVAGLLRMETARLRPAVPVVRGRGQLREGLRHVRGTPELSRPLLMMAVIGGLAFEYPVVLPVLAERTFHAGPEAYGLMLGVIGAGAVAGGLFFAARGRTGRRRLVVCALLLGASLAATAVAPSLELALAALAFVGAASVGFTTTGNSTVQLAAAPHMRGRVMALWAVAFLGTTPVGGPLVGAVSEHLGGRSGLWVGVLGCLIAAGIGAHGGTARRDDGRHGAASSGRRGRTRETHSERTASTGNGPPSSS